MQWKKKISDVQVFYNNRWVSKINFAAFVYDKNNNQKLASTYEDFSQLLETGLWFSEKQESKQKVRKIRKVKAQARKPDDDGDS